MQLKKYIFFSLIFLYFYSSCNIEINLIKDIFANYTKKATLSKNLEKYNVSIYMAADNDLFPFAERNLKQLQNIGSNERLNILVHLDKHRPGQKKSSKRLFVEKNKITQIGPDMFTDSGSPQTLIDFCKWSFENYKADKYVIILWNHGTGALEPKLTKAINPSELFLYNTETKLIELNRKIGFIDYIHSKNSQNKKSRGICFDDTTGSYLTNKKLKETLTFISKEILNGQKISILACDACLMSSLEVVAPLQNCVDFFVGSEEVELGTGYNYSSVLSPFLTNSLKPFDFATHIVAAFKNTYSKITLDFTHSALDLSYVNLLEKNVDNLAKSLILGISKQANNSVKEAIKISRNKNFCTYFDEPTYIDTGHFYLNLLNNIHKCVLISDIETNNFKNDIINILQQGLNILSKLVIANEVGKNLNKAQGISIYFPERYIYSSYYDSEFAKTTNWLNFLQFYLKN